MKKINVWNVKKTIHKIQKLIPILTINHFQLFILNWLTSMILSDVQKLIRVISIKPVFLLHLLKIPKYTPMIKFIWKFKIVQDLIMLMKLSVKDASLTLIWPIKKKEFVVKTDKFLLIMNVKIMKLSN